MNPWALLPLELQRRRLARTAPAGPLRSFYLEPLPPATSEWRDVAFLAVDLETTGLDARTGEVVSVGWVEVRHSTIDLSTASRRIVRTSRSMPEQSAVIHSITDDEAAKGEPLDEVLAGLLRALAGRVLLAHYLPTESGFLDAACVRCYGAGFRTPAVDTVQLARAGFARRGKAPASGELRLDALRARHGLPRHSSHDALSDALATAELFLAQVEELGAAGPVKLKALLAHRS